MNRFSEYTTDELLALRPYGITADHIADEIEDRRELRNIWLDYCNEQAGEIIC